MNVKEPSPAGVSAGNVSDPGDGNLLQRSKRTSGGKNGKPFRRMIGRQEGPVRGPPDHRALPASPEHCAPVVTQAGTRSARTSHPSRPVTQFLSFRLLPPVLLPAGYFSVCLKLKLHIPRTGQFVSGILLTLCVQELTQPAWSPVVSRLLPQGAWSVSACFGADQTS